MQLLTVPNWSFGRDKALLRKFREILSSDLITLHYCESDVDHNRTVTAFSGDEEVLTNTIVRLAMEAFDSIDLTRHVGVHPRIGALDVCPFVICKPDRRPADIQLMNALAVAEKTADLLAGMFDLPVFLYEKSERGRHEADLPSLRKGGFGALLERELKPDFGPSRAHLRLGMTVLGVRDFLIALNVNLEGEDLEIAKKLARQIRQLRTEGDARFLGVRALGLPLTSRKLTQISLNLTLPDLTPVDPIVEWIYEQVTAIDVRIANTELIGVIRDIDVPTASRLPIKPSQIVEI